METVTTKVQPRSSALRPALVLLLAFVVFSWGIWNARVGLGDDTGPMLEALRAAEEGRYPSNPYVLFYSLLLRWITPDPMQAALVMRAAVSLFTTLALFYVLSAFSAYLHRMAVMMACTVWMVSFLNSPLIQYANLSPFTFGIAALGLGWLLRRRSWSGLLGFMLAITCAASLRPEYFAPALLIGGVSGVALLWQTLRPRVGVGALWGALAVVVLLVAVAIVPRFRGGGMDGYLLFGLGQCYAEFYKAEHPEAALHPMTEYQELLDKTFGNPTSFFGAIGNNPREACRYFALNTLNNLKLLPSSLLSTRQTRFPSSLLTGRLHALFLLMGLLIGGALLIQRIFTVVRQRKTGSWREALRRSQSAHSALLWQVLCVMFFCSASSVAIILLVPSSRYWISLVPLVFLIVAACFDALLRLPVFAKRSWLLWAPTLVLFCRPLFLDFGPNENYEVNALRHILPKLPDNPVIAGIYTRPHQVYAFRGRAISVNAGADLSATGVREGRYDVLIVDGATRASRVWKENRAFFEAFELEPALSGYVKLTEVFTGRSHIYYRPRVATPP